MIVAITDRKLMVPAELRDWPAIADAFATAVRAANADIVQVREKDLDGGPLLMLVRAAIATGARVMVNDRVDVALAAGAYGVHLPERGMSIEDARALAPRLAIGVSRHTIDTLDVDADYVHLGPIWDSPGKGPMIGPSELIRARERTRAKLIAVGGVDSREHMLEAMRLGADGVAAIRAVWSGALRG